MVAAMSLFGGCGGSPAARDVSGETAAKRKEPEPAARAFDADRAMQHIRQLSVEIGPRAGGSEAEHRAAAYIGDAFSQLGYANVMEQAFPSDLGRPSYNVYVEDVGSRPQWVIIVGAHYDSAGGTGSPGANDNASGVGVMLELARVYRSREQVPTLLFAAFGSEEYPENSGEDEAQGGSAYMAGRLGEIEGEVIGMVNLDMVGVGGEFFTFATLEAPGTLLDLFMSYAEEQEIEVAFEQDPGDWSDNGSFEGAGITSFTLERQLDPDYHTPGDSFDRVERSGVEQCGRLLGGFLEKLGWYSCLLLQAGAERKRSDRQ